MRVSEAVTLPSSEFARPLELSGYLIVSSHLVCVVEDEATAHSGRPHYGVLVNRDALQVLTAAEIPMMAGSSVSLAGQIALKGTVTHTGISTLPLYLPYIYELSFSNDAGSWTFQIGDVYRDVYLLSRPPVAPHSIAALKPLFPSELTVMQLKRLLDSEAEHCVGRHLRGDAFLTLTAAIDAAGFMWRAEECPIIGGIP